MDVIIGDIVKVSGILGECTVLMLLPHIDENAVLMETGFATKYGSIFATIDFTRYRIDSKETYLLGRKCFLVSKNKITAIYRHKDILTSVMGCICKVCNVRNEYAVPNRPEGKYVCYNCRDSA